VPAYAATIHKSKGSEYPAVVIPVLTQHYTMLQRNLLYTGVTRGKRLLVLVGQRKALPSQCAMSQDGSGGRNCRNGWVHTTKVFPPHAEKTIRDGSTMSRPKA
jgi:UvrD-like helicase C-terminal domain